MEKYNHTPIPSPVESEEKFPDADEFFESLFKNNPQATKTLPPPASLQTNAVISGNDNSQVGTNQGTFARFTFRTHIYKAPVVPILVNIFKRTEIIY